jgi:glutamine amidotransferase
MCRLFGFRSNVPAKVHRSLVLEKNSLLFQSREHKDGWGIASYANGSVPEVAHGIGAAHCDPEFERVSSLLDSKTVLAHVRLASVGKVSPENAHPFVCHDWAFAHNGTVTGFANHQAAIEALLRPDFRARLRGETDSERCFYLFLTHLQSADGDSRNLASIARALAQTVKQVAQLSDSPEKRSSLNFLVTDGLRMVAIRRNRTLFFSEGHKKDRQREPPRDGDRPSQVVVASEELSGESHWHEISEETLIGIDADLTLRFWTLDQLAG